jgi:hypothetical protein
VRHSKRIALGLIVLFALQAGGAAAAVVARGSCCPPGAEARSEGSPPPCRTVAPAGCCEERTAPSASDPTQGAQLLACGVACPATLAAEPFATPVPRPPPNQLRALRSVVLRL